MARQSGSDFSYKNGKFLARCRSESCRRDRTGIVEMVPKDMRIKDPAKLKLKHWPVREMVLHYYDWTDEAQIFWKIPDDYKRAVLFGDLHTLATADLGVLDAINKDVLFKFREDRIFHAKEPTLSGLKTKGWGLPRTLYLARQAWTLQMLRKQIQALGIDFIVPMRIVTPANKNVSGGSTGVMVNPAASMKHEDFARMISVARAKHRRDPTNWHSLQVPIEYSVLGGEASQVFPADLHAMAKEDLLDAGGFPIDIYKANLTIQSAPVGLRLFEAQNRSIPTMLNHALSFVARRVAELSLRSPIAAKHQRVVLVDNIESSMMRLQLAMSGSTSMTNALKPLNMNYEEEVRQNFEDQRLMQDLQRENQELMAKQDQSMQMMQNAMQPQDPAAGGAPAAAGDPAMMDPTAGMLPSNGLMLPSDIQGLESSVGVLAETLAQMDHQSRQRELAILREQNPTAHALLRTRLEQADNQLASAGKQMMLQGGM